jgi:hypothetical protein
MNASQTANPFQTNRIEISTLLLRIQFQLNMLSPVFMPKPIRFVSQKHMFARRFSADSGAGVPPCPFDPVTRDNVSPNTTSTNPSL